MEWLTIAVYYAVIILLIAHFRKKFNFHAWLNLGFFKFPFVAQLKTKLGLGLMKSIGEKHSRIVRILADIGIVVGYIGMVFVFIYVFYGLFNLFINPDAPQTFTPVIPGATIGGFKFPFWHTLIALFITVVIHEFSHGVVSRAYKIKVTSSGYAQVGPFSAAFVEPDEKALQQSSGRIQNAIFAAGPWSNFLTAIIVFLLLIFVLSPISASMSSGTALTFTGITPDSPAETAGLMIDTDYVRANNVTNLSTASLSGLLQDAKPGDIIEFETETGAIQTVTLANKGDGTPLIGIEGLTTQVIPKGNEFWFSIWMWIVTLFNWVFILSVGLGLGNLIPAGPLDGGRMYLVACQKFFGKKKGEAVWAKTAIVLFSIIIILFITPIVRDALPGLKSLLGL